MIYVGVNSSNSSSKLGDSQNPYHSISDALNFINNSTEKFIVILKSDQYDYLLEGYFSITAYSITFTYKKNNEKIKK